MGGGPAEPDVNAEEYGRLVRRLLVLSSSSATPDMLYGQLENDYEEIDRNLTAVESAKGETHTMRLIAKCASHALITRELRKVAGRYKTIEMETWELMVRCFNLLSVFTDADITIVVEVFIGGDPDVRRALQKGLEQLQALSHTMTAVAAVHDAVFHDLSTLMLKAQEVVDVPSRADAGFAAAPVFGGAALGVVALGLRALGPIGLLSSVALVGAGAAGTSELAKTLHPAVKVRFMRLREEIGAVAERVRKMASSLHHLSSDLEADSQRLLSLLEVALNGNGVSEQLISEGLPEFVTNVEDRAKTCRSCCYTRSPFLTVSSLLPEDIKGI